ncbi:CoA transferase [Aeromicrobium sp. UC242_57]|uniref:CoA transferase n=1 Tax=Aeromicrobium sp. UC242_57 TaxID=3374624 RepID=UPI0037B6CB38
MREVFAEKFSSRTRAEWTEVFDGSDACVAPVLSLAEAAGHPHLAARQTFVEVGGLVQPAPAPRFSRTSSPVPEVPPAVGAHTCEVLEAWGIDDVDSLLAAGVAIQA